MLVELTFDAVLPFPEREAGLLLSLGFNLTQPLDVFLLHAGRGTVQRMAVWTPAPDHSVPDVGVVGGDPVVDTSPTLNVTYPARIEHPGKHVLAIAYRSPAPVLTFVRPLNLSVDGWTWSVGGGVFQSRSDREEPDAQGSSASLAPLPTSARPTGSTSKVQGLPCGGWDSRWAGCGLSSGRTQGPHGPGKARIQAWTPRKAARGSFDFRLSRGTWWFTIEADWLRGGSFFPA